MHYLGIDLHKDESHVAVLDDDAEVVEEIRVKNANLDDVAEEYAGAKAALEATSNYYTVYDTLDEYLDVVVADRGKTKAIGYAEVKNDRLDAKLIAQLRRAGMIAESHVPSEDSGSAAHLCAAGSDWSKSARTSKTKSLLYSTNT